MLPPRSFYCIAEVAVRWSATPFDVIGWSTEQLLAISVALPPVKLANGGTVSGLVDVEGIDLLPLFRRDALPSQSVPIRRVKDGAQGFNWISVPAEAVTVTAADVLVRRSEVSRFEKQFGLFTGQPLSTNDDKEVPQKRRAGPGAPPRYDWDRFYGALARFIHDHGIPRTQAELVRAMLQWFENSGIDKVPDESSVTSKIRLVWSELHRL
jgi:hypothetical protein